MDKNIISKEELEMEKQRIFNILNDVREEKTAIPVKKDKSFKLYLNNLKNLFNNKQISNKLNLIQRLRIKIKIWWMNESTETIRDLIMFILIHGFMGLNIFLSLLTITNVDLAIVNIIKQNVLLTLIVYLISTGSIYYLMIDFNKVIVGSWGRTPRNKR